MPWEELPAHYGAGDVFAMPCRTRRGGLDVEGLGIVYLEASATGLPVVAGDSGGAPDAVLDGETGWVVRGGSVEESADRIATLLGDPELRQRMGERGRAVGALGVAEALGPARRDRLAVAACDAGVGRGVTSVLTHCGGARGRLLVLRVGASAACPCTGLESRPLPPRCTSGRRAGTCRCELHGDEATTE